MQVDKFVMKVIVLVIISLFFMSCIESPVDSKSNLIASTNKSEYKINEEITYNIFNYTASTAFVKFCGSFSLNWIEKKQEANNEWEVYFMPVIPAICGDISMKLEAGEKMEWSIAVIDEPGKYRFVIPANNDSIIIQDDKVYSNVFVVN